MSFNAISAKALAASRARTPDQVVLGVGADARGQRAGLLHLHAVDEPAVTVCARRCACCSEEGLEHVFARHRRLAEAARAAVKRVGPRDPLPLRRRAQPGRDDGDDAGRGTTPTNSAQSSLERFNLSLGAGLGRLKGRAFRIGHLGDFNELMLMATLCGVEMGLSTLGRAVHEGRRRRGDGTSDNDA